MQFIRVVLTCVVLLLAAAARVYAQAPLDVARDLYATADYEKALGLLDDLIARNDAGQKRQEAELYRALCFLALGKREDADRAVETIVQRDPLYRAPDDIAPRMRTAFGDAKKRLLPSIIQQHYNSAKAAFDAKDFGAAGDGFQRVLDALERSRHEARRVAVAAGGPEDAGVRLPRPERPDDSAAAAGCGDPGRAAARAAGAGPVAGGVEDLNGTEPGIIPPVAIVAGVSEVPGPGAVWWHCRRGGDRDRSDRARWSRPRCSRRCSRATTRSSSTPRATGAISLRKVNGQPVKFRKSIRITVVPDRVGTN